MSKEEKSVTVSVMLVEVGANMGDHAQDVFRAQEVDPSETVGELAERLLLSKGWGSRSFDYQSRIEIRVAEPKLELPPIATEPWAASPGEPF